MRPFGAAGKGTGCHRGAATGSSRSTPSTAAAMPSGGLSMAFASGADAAGKKRGLASLNTTASAPADLFAGKEAASGASSSQQKQPSASPGGLYSALGSGLYSPSGGALSPLSEATHTSAGSHRTPLSDALAIASRPRCKVPRRLGLPPADGAESDASDGDGFDAVAGTLPGGWAIGTPPHLLAADGRQMHGAVSMPVHQADPFDNFRPGSVMEGAGRKLRGTEAMRMRNAVLRQTGFLEPNTNNLFSDHVEDHPEDQFEDHYEDGGLEALAIPL